MTDPYVDCDTETWTRLSDHLRAVATPGECRVETLSRVLRSGALGASLVVFDLAEYGKAIEALEHALQDPPIETT